MFSNSSLHLRYFSPMSMSNRFTYSDRLLVCRGSNSFGNFLLCGHHNPKLPACPDSNWPYLYYLGVSHTVPSQTKATMIVLSGFILIISFVSSQLTTFERDQQNLRLVNNRTILSIHERWNKKYGTWLQQSTLYFCSCKDYPDGTPCTKRCIDITCDSKMARCWKVSLMR